MFLTTPTRVRHVNMLLSDDLRAETYELSRVQAESNQVRAESNEACDEQADSDQVHAESDM
jgi:hypothetical protein